MCGAVGALVGHEAHDLVSGEARGEGADGLALAVTPPRISDADIFDLNHTFAMSGVGLMLAQNLSRPRWYLVLHSLSLISIYFIYHSSTVRITCNVALH